jgi:hypothetical protein
MFSLMNFTSGVCSIRPSIPKSAAEISTSPARSLSAPIAVTQPPIEWPTTARWRVSMPSGPAWAGSQKGQHRAQILRVLGKTEGPRCPTIRDS